MHFKYKDTDKLKVNGWKRLYQKIYKCMPCKSKHKKTKGITRNKKWDVMIKDSRKSW